MSLSCLMGIGMRIKSDGWSDSTGTQGKDSLSDDSYTGSSKKPDEHPNDTERHTGSSSEDFSDVKDDEGYGFLYFVF